MLKAKTVLEFAIGGALLLAPLDLRAQSLKAVPIQETGVHVALGDITDSRTTGKFFEYLRIELKLSGGAIETAFGATKPAITEAVDDTGRALVKDSTRKDALFWNLQLNESKKTSLDQSTDLLNPARRATTISMLGYVDVLEPQEDPDSVYTIKNFPASAGQSLAPKEVAKRGVEITVLTKTLADRMKQDKAAAAERKADSTSPSADQALSQAFGKVFESLFSGFLRMGDNDLLFVVKDTQSQIAYIQIADEAGAPLKTGSRSISQDQDSGVYNFSVGLNAPVPATAQLKIYFATPKSLIHVPFKFENVPLP
jgi:hypothetical protein